MADFLLSQAFIRNGLPTTQNSASPQPIWRQSLGPIPTHPWNTIFPLEGLTVRWQYLPPAATTRITTTPIRGTR